LKVNGDAREGRGVTVSEGGFLKPSQEEADYKPRKLQS
jgi:hypothetical protein